MDARPPDLPYVWWQVLSNYAAGMLDATDVWDAVDEFGAGRLPDPARLPLHAPDLAGPDEAALVQEQATRVDALLRAFVAGALTPDDLAAEALVVLGLADDDPAPDSAGNAGTDG